jgi:RNA polymerase sigma-70 factor (ECF subfamily)
MSQSVAEGVAGLLPRLHRFATRLTGARDAADDIVQAAVERALSRAWQWQPGTRLDSWMFSIVHSVWSNELRSRRVRAHEPLDAALEVCGSDGERAVSARIALRGVARGVAGLPRGQRQAIALVCVEGYTHREAAAILGVPIGTVISRLARGRRALAAQPGHRAGGRPGRSAGRLSPAA